MATAKRIGEGLTFEKIWATFQEAKVVQEAENQTLKERMEADNQALKERMEETVRQMRETDKQLKERLEETARIVRENAKQLGSIHNRFGEIVEYMVVPNLVTKFNELGLPFTKANPDTKITDKEHGIFTEVDAFLENGDKVMIVETKTKPTIDDIKDHIKRMEKLRKYADLHDDKRKYLGAVAGVVFGDSEKTYAFENGFYVIEPSGDTFNITEPAGAYYPHEW